MKAKGLQSFSLFVMMGIGTVAISRAADAPANPFGPKPVAPTPSSATSSQLEAVEPNYTPDKFVATVRQMLLERFDKDKDGTLDGDEQAEARALFSGVGTGTGGQVVRAARPNLPAAGGPLFGLRPLIMSNFGKENTDTLNAAEMAKLRGFLFGAKTAPTKPTNAAAEVLQQDILKQFDQNGDGKLDATELATAKTTLQQIMADLGKNTAPAKSPISSPVKPAPAATSTPPTL